MYLTPITEIEISDIINSVCRKKASGRDEVPCCLIKDVSIYLVYPNVPHKFKLSKWTLPRQIENSSDN